MHVTGAVKAMLKCVAKAGAGVVPAGLVAGLGLPALGALVFLAAAVLGLICWVIGNQDRSDRVTQMILARTGDASCLARGPTTQLPPAAKLRSWPWHRRSR
jgi:hypothetical protein